MNTKLIKFHNIKEQRGDISILEKDHLPFPIKRIYLIYNIPKETKRGKHAHKEQNEILIATSGSFDIILDNGNSKKKIHLSNPKEGLLIPKGIWRELENFSSDAVCLVLASDEFSEDDYIREYNDFLKSNNIK